jgi:hypothetical protein
MLVFDIAASAIRAKYAKPRKDMSQGRVIKAVLQHREEINRLIREEHEVAVDELRGWVNKQGIVAKDRASFGEALKKVFPEFVVNGRWAPIKAILAENVESGSNASRKNKPNAPTQSSNKVPENRISGRHVKANKETNSDQDNKDSEVIYRFKSGVELDKEALKYVDQDTLDTGLDMIIYGTIRQTSKGYAYMVEREKINEKEGE